MAAPSSETEMRMHPYQWYGPKGPYECRQVMFKPVSDAGGPSVPGLYVRVDMPGVPDDTIKIVKNSDTQTVNFTGKAPKLWAHFDTSDRVYAGYIVVDRDPADIHVNSEFKDGCLRMYIPRCDGSLHFLSPPSNNTNITNTQSAQVVVDEGEEDDTVEIIQVRGVGMERYLSFVEHAPDSPVMTLRGGRPLHINPFLLSGVESVYEHKIVYSDNGEQLVYVRLDVPDGHYKWCFIGECAGPITFTADPGWTSATRCSPCDERGRSYIGMIKPKCKCRMLKVVQHDIKAGVIRFVAQRVPANTPDPPNRVCAFKPPVRPGDAPIPTMADLDVEELMNSFK